MKESAAANAAELRIHRVDVVEPAVPARRHRIRCEIGENLKFDTAGLEAYCFANWDERIFDALVLAAAVQFCDHTKARPSARWGRDIMLRVPVHDPAHGVRQPVSGALQGALGFLTGDRWRLEFIARKKPESPPRQGNFSLPDGARVVIPFSDGLDSRAVAGLAEREHGHKLIRVRLGSRSLNGHRTDGERVPFASVPYRVRYGRRGSVETSARSRGLKFALLSGIAAYLSQARQVIVPESGQGASGRSLFRSAKPMRTTGTIPSLQIAWKPSCRRCLTMRFAIPIRASGTPRPKRLRRSLPRCRMARTGRRRARAGKDSGKYRYLDGGASAASVPPVCSDA